jgi:predicted metal-binding protein
MTSISNSTTSKHDHMEHLFNKHGFSDFKWMNPKNIIVSQWVRMKCMFGCRDYGKNAACPPNVPSVIECEKFFNEYSEAVVFHFQKQVEKPEDRHAWTKKVNSALLKLERQVFLAGYERAFLLFMDGCSFCADCTEEREKCQQPQLSRPTVEAMAVDVYTTVRQIGYSVHVLAEYSQPMNRYAFLLIQ